MNTMNLRKMSYADALLSDEANNCGVYIVYEGNNIIYIGKASGQTLKRRLSEHVSYDNEYNSLTRKMSVFKNIPLSNIEKIFEYIIKNLKFSLIPYNVHNYKRGQYFYDHDEKEKIIAKERDLIETFTPILNKRGNTKIKK